MKSKIGIMALMFIAIFSMVYVASVVAEPARHGGGQHGMKGQGGKGMHHGSGKHGGGYGAHIFGPSWKETLTKEQALQIDKLHLKLKKESSVIKAKAKVAKLEMAILLIADSPNQSKINKKLQQVLELKQQKMKLHNAHVIEMRKVLTEEQRVSFDSKMLSMAKSGHKGH